MPRGKPVAREGEEAQGAEEATYPLRTVVRLTGLSPHVLRAWERRYQAVRPARSAGGTRRYRASEVARLRLLRAAVDAGHSIGALAKLDDAGLRERAGLDQAEGLPILAPILDAVEALDGSESERLLGLQLSALGPRRFAADVAAPLLYELGERWAAGRLPIAAEHLASATVRNLLGSVLQRHSAPGAPVLVFATPPGERHEMGTLMGAVTAAEAGADVTFLGPDLPLEEIQGVATRLGARAVALGVVTLTRSEASTLLTRLRAGLPRQCELWVGGAGSLGLRLPPGAQRLGDLEELERRVELLLA